MNVGYECVLLSFIHVHILGELGHTHYVATPSPYLLNVFVMYMYVCLNQSTILRVYCLLFWKDYCSLR